jgi:hypothetical protein
MALASVIPRDPDGLGLVLREVDAAVSQAVLDSLGDHERRRLDEEAERAVARHRGRVDERALADAKRRFVVGRLRDRLGLPWVGGGS